MERLRMMEREQGDGDREVGRRGKEGKVKRGRGKRGGVKN
jgi:hypothetical protein